MYSVYQNHLVEIINNAPRKTLSVKEKKRRFKPWIIPWILASTKTKNYCKKCIKTKAKLWYNRYKYYRDKLNALISKSKKNPTYVNTFKRTIMTLKNMVKSK